MARRETERDTYGGERRWAEGAGESWTSVRNGHAAEHGSGKETDPESTLWRGSEPPHAHESGVLRKLADSLGRLNSSQRVVDLVRIDAQGAYNGICW